MAKGQVILRPNQAGVSDFDIAIALDRLTLYARSACHEALHQIAVTRLDVRFEEPDPLGVNGAPRFSKIALALEIEPIDLLILQIAQ